MLKCYHLFSGTGTWSRRRECNGDFPETCVGPTDETSSCDVTDCVDACIPNPCKNEGLCRSNSHLTRLYHCICSPGWMGKHCNRRKAEVTTFLYQNYSLLELFYYPP